MKKLLILICLLIACSCIRYSSNDITKEEVDAEMSYYQRISKAILYAPDSITVIKNFQKDIKPYLKDPRNFKIVSILVETVYEDSVEYNITYTGLGYYEGIIDLSTLYTYYYKTQKFNIRYCTEEVRNKKPNIITGTNQ